MRSAHLQREDAHRPPLADRHVLGDVQGEAGLAHAGAAGDDDQVPLVQPLGDAVEVDEAGRDAGEHAPRPLFDLLQRRVEDVAQQGEAALDRLLAEAEDRLLGAPEGGLGVEPAVQAVADDLARRLDEAPADGALLDDLDVGVDAPDVREVEVQAGQVGETTDGAELVLLLQLGLESTQVDLDQLLL